MGGKISYRGVVKGGTIVLTGGDALPEGTEVMITPLSPGAGTPAAILAAMAAEPHLTKEDVEALERSIEEGNRLFERKNPKADRPQEGKTQP
jgi:hypothetical protein